MHRGSEHGMQRRRFALGGEARSQRYRPNVIVRMTAGLGLGEGHSSEEGRVTPVERRALTSDTLTEETEDR